MERTIIIAGGGVGKRMGAAVPKQFLEIKGKPILVYTIEKFLRVFPDIQVVLVLPANQHSKWMEIKQRFLAHQSIHLVAGGQERFHSVKNGLAAAQGDFIGVHDAVRPLVDEDVIKKSFEAASLFGSGIPVVDVTQSLRKSNGHTSEAVNRRDYKLVQTPQVFDAATLRKAYALPFDSAFTDDASVVEASGCDVFLCKGNSANIKITEPIDLVLAEALLSESK